MIVILLFGFLALGAAIRFARKPELETVGAVRALSMATTFAVLGGTASDLGAVFHYMVSHDTGDETLTILFTGLSESMAPAILGFSLLAVTWFVSAAGLRRVGAVT